MLTRLYLRPELPLVTEGQAYQWAAYEPSGRQLKQGKGASLDDVAQTLMQNGLEQVDAVLILPAELAYSSSVSLPGTQARFVPQALPFAVEEQLAQELDSVHLAVGAKGKGSVYPVSIVDRAMFEMLFDECMEHDAFSLRDIVIDAQVLESDQYNFVAVVADDRVLFAENLGRSLSVHPANFVPFMETLLSDDEASEDDESLPSDEEVSLKLMIHEQYTGESQLLKAQLEQYPNLDLVVEGLSASDFEYCCHLLEKRPKGLISLCQGEYKIAQGEQGLLSQWMPVAAVLLIGFFIQLGVFIGKGVYYEQQAELVAAEAIESYKKAVPGAKPRSVGQLAKIIEGKLRQAGAAGDTSLGFMGLMGQSGSSYVSLNERENLHFHAINYNQQRGELVIEMHTRSYDYLENFKNALEKEGLVAKISSAVQEKNSFVGRINVSAG